VRILGRYILKEHRAPFLFALAALTGLLVLNQLARQFTNLIGKGLPWEVIATFFGLSFPFILAMTLPMAVLVATLHAFSRLAADSEVTALRASGVNLRRAMVPVLLAAGTVMLAEFVWVDQVLPRANHRLKNLMIDIARKKPTFELREQMVNEIEPGRLFLRAGRIDQAADRMRDVVIYDLSHMDRRRTIYADSGYIRFNPARTDLFLTLFDGYIHDYDRAQAGTFRRIFFATDFVRVRGVSNQLERTESSSMRSDREQSLCEMEAVVQGDLRAVQAIEAERGRAIRNDVLALVGVAPPPGPADSLPPPRGRMTLTAVYCRLLGLLGRGATPSDLHAQEPRRWRDRMDQRPAKPPPARVRPADALSPCGARQRCSTPPVTRSRSTRSTRSPSRAWSSCSSARRSPSGSRAAGWAWCWPPRS
jgi:lipopolysaccharide export system permease protein